ncbi:unnamed protein product, partial [marine sediment metagenome]
SRVTGSGINVNTNNYLSTIKMGINWAQNEFCMVQFQLLLKSMEWDTVANWTQYGLFDQNLGEQDFGKEDKIYYYPASGDKVELTRCTVSDIETIGATMTPGIPQFYAIGGYIYQTAGDWNDDVRSVYLGMPTPDAKYPMKVYYYRTLPELVDNSDVSLISKAYNDDPIIEGAVWKFAQALNRDLSPELFYRSMKTAQDILPYSGPPYPEKLTTPKPTGQ